MSNVILKFVRCANIPALQKKCKKISLMTVSVQDLSFKFQSDIFTSITVLNIIGLF